jgi:hypothetical protein
MFIPDPGSRGEKGNGSWIWIRHTVLLGKKMDVFSRAICSMWYVQIVWLTLV